MRRFGQSLVVFMTAGILLGTCVFRSAADESNVTEKSAPAKSEQDIQRLIELLGSKRFKDREQAAAELSRLGKSALPSLKEATRSADAEVRRRAQQLVERIEPPPVRSTSPRVEPELLPGKCYL